MFGYFKYKLLCWLLGDICQQSDCDTCGLNTGESVISLCPCVENRIYTQARKAWNLEE